MSWIDNVTNLVKNAPDAATGWPRLLQLCRDTTPSPLWSDLPALEPERDVRAASRWLGEQLRDPSAPKPARGLYLGLDTLNMDGPDGFNVEIAATAHCDPFKLETEWVYHCEWYGDWHLIESLRDLKEVYEAPQYEPVAEFADYALFLGYSGLVFADAIEKLEVDAPLLVAWGFHDGDLFFLGRREREKFERICAVF